MTDREKIKAFIEWLDDDNSDESTEYITVTKAEIMLEELEKRRSYILNED